MNLEEVVTASYDFAAAYELGQPCGEELDALRDALLGEVIGSVANLRALEGRTVRTLSIGAGDVIVTCDDGVQFQIRVGVTHHGYDPFDSVLVSVKRPGDAKVDVDAADSGAVTSEVARA